MKQYRAVIVSVLVVLMAACNNAKELDPNSVNLGDAGAKFKTLNDKHFKPPSLSTISGDYVNTGASVWGAHGRDRLGRIYFAVSNYKDYNASSFLYQYDPRSNQITPQSDALTELKRNNQFMDGMSQNKLHSKLFQAEDGYLYFSSFDETGESSTKNPTWGGVFWRKKPESIEWEYLFSTEEALIAVNSNGRFVYALGYWGHVLYQYDTQKDAVRKIKVGSVPGHISRNFLVTNNGHVFVPKISGPTDLMVELIEYDEKLFQVNTFRLNEYWNTNANDNHGIVSYVQLKNGSTLFLTSTGNLYEIVQMESDRSKVNSLGPISDTGEKAYVSSLFSPDGEEMLVGLGRNEGAAQYQWYLYNIPSKTLVSYPVKDIDLNKHLLYGSLTSDNDGDFYIVGSNRQNSEKHRPIVLKASY